MFWRAWKLVRPSASRMAISPSSSACRTPRATRRSHDFRKGVRPILAGAADERHGPIVYAAADPVAVVPHLVQPFIAAGICFTSREAVACRGGMRVFTTGRSPAAMFRRAAKGGPTDLLRATCYVPRCRRAKGADVAKVPTCQSAKVRRVAYIVQALGRDSGGPGGGRMHRKPGRFAIYVSSAVPRPLRRLPAATGRIKKRRRLPKPNGSAG